MRCTAHCTDISTRIHQVYKAFYFILFYFIDLLEYIFYFSLSCLILYYLISSYLILSYLILSYLMNIQQQRENSSPVKHLLSVGLLAFKSCMCSLFLVLRWCWCQNTHIILQCEAQTFICRDRREKKTHILTGGGAISFAFLTSKATFLQKKLRFLWAFSFRVDL